MLPYRTFYTSIGHLRSQGLRILSGDQGHVMPMAGNAVTWGSIFILRNPFKKLDDVIVCENLR